MALWNNNDREQSKPTWLTEEQRRLCVRTVRGWEIPLVGSGTTGSTANPFLGKEYITNSATNVVEYELLVAMPLDPSPTGATQSLFTSRGTSAGVYGATSGDNVNNLNYAPYFTTPLSGDTFVTSFGATAYLPLIAVDYNSTEFANKISFTLTSGTAGSSLVLLSPLTGGATAQIGATQWNFPTSVTSSAYPFGGFGGVTFNAAVVRISATLTSGTYGCTASVWDNRPGTGITSSVPFTIRII